MRSEEKGREESRSFMDVSPPTHSIPLISSNWALTTPHSKQTCLKLIQAFGALILLMIGQVMVAMDTIEIYDVTSARGS